MEPSMKLEAAEGEEYFEANLPEMAFDDSSINDVELLLAHRQSLESGSLTPLLKQELRCKIQSRRLNEGKDELLVKFDNPRNCQLTEEDMERRERRREQNRRAAQRFRQKRKLEGSGVVQELQELLQINSILHARVVELQEEKQRLQHALEDHIAVCDHPFSFAECFLNMP